MTGLPQVPTFDVLGVKVSAISLQMAVEYFESVIANDGRTYVCVTGVHGVMECQSDENLRHIHNRAGLVTPDGMPLVWLGRRAGNAGMDRVYGPDLMLEMCARSEATGHRHFFYGGKEGVASRLAQRLNERFPNLKVAGWYTPPFGPLSASQEEDLIRTVEASRPDVFWVGLSTPKQERFMASMCGRLPVPIMAGVGAAFDFHAGLKRQAPVWIQRSGFEWLFRMAMEPRRLTGRYMKNNPAFVALVVAQQLGLRRFDAETVTRR